MEKLDYESLCIKYQDGIPCPPDFNYPKHVLDARALSDPNILAIHWVSSDFKTELKYTYAELADASNRAAIFFHQQGIRKGDGVMIVLPKVCDWWIAVYGLMRIGAIPIPGTSLLQGKDLEYRAIASKAIAFIGDDTSCTNVEAIAKNSGIKAIYQINTSPIKKGRICFDSAWKFIAKGTKFVSPVPLYSIDICITFFTSGTTGMPKMVLLDHGSLLGHHITAGWYRLRKGDYFSNTVDLGWAKCSYWSHSAFNTGATLFVQSPEPGAFNPRHMLKALHQYPIRVMCAPPTVYRSLTTSASLQYFSENPPMALSHCVGAGEPLNAQVIHDWQRATGIEICDGYGQSETNIVVGNFLGMKIKPGSMGKMAPNTIVGILGLNGLEGVGDEGEIAVRVDVGGGGQWLFKGYLKEGGKLDTRQRTLKDGSVWYCTGDRAYKDSDSYFHFVGRDDDVISSAGYRIGPFEVESTLKQHPAVLESAVVASPHPERNEIVKAFIILNDNYLTKDPKTLILELQEFCKTTASPYKYPREIEFTRTLPKTVSGKIRRIELRNQEYEKKKDIVKALKSKL